jgi:hypothetical protein
MDNATLVIGILTFLGGLISLYYSRRGIKAKASADEADAMTTYTEANMKLQDRNQELYERNVELEKKLSECDRSRETLTVRLSERDTQIATLNKQFEKLNELAKQAPITDILKEQLSVTNGVIERLQAAYADANRMLIEKEKINQELQRQTNRDLTMKRAE